MCKVKRRHYYSPKFHNTDKPHSSKKATGDLWSSFSRSPTFSGVQQPKGKHKQRPCWAPEHSSHAHVPPPGSAVCRRGAAAADTPVIPSAFSPRSRLTLPLLQGVVPTRCWVEKTNGFPPPSPGLACLQQGTLLLLNTVLWSSSAPSWTPSDCCCLFFLFYFPNALTLSTSDCRFRALETTQEIDYKWDRIMSRINWGVFIMLPVTKGATPFHLATAFTASLRP